MNQFFEALTTVGWVPFAADVAWKSLLILCAALALTSALRRRTSASVRHHVWALAFASLLALPVLAASLPSLQVAVPGWTSEAGAAVPTVRPTVEAGVTAASAEVSATSEMSAAPTPTVSTTSGSVVVEGAGRAGTAVFAVWLLGMLVLLGRLGLGVGTAWYTSRRATPVHDPSWTRATEAVAAELGVHTAVRILASDRVATPMVWGLVRPVLLLPPDAIEWSAERRRAVLLHELGHVKRRDCLTHVVAQAVRAVHWLNPLAWVAARRLRAERERACDDLVLSSGTSRSDYAQLLLDVARGRADRRLSYATVSMARRSELEGRLLAILDPALNRRGIGRAAAVATIGLVAGVLIPLAAFQATRWGGDPAPVADEAPVVSVSVAPSPDVRVRPDVKVHVGRQEAPFSDEDQERAVAAMLQALENERPSIREQAAHGLGMLESPLGVAGLSDAARSDESAEVRAQAAWALGMIEDAAGVPALAEAVRDDDAEVRAQAAWALGMIESPGGVAPLLRGLRDESAEVRAQSAWGLGMIESAEAVEGLIGVLGSDDTDEVRSQAAWALGMIEDRSALDALLDAIEDESDEVAEQAMWALGMVMG